MKRLGDRHGAAFVVLNQVCLRCVCTFDLKMCFPVCVECLLFFSSICIDGRLLAFARTERLARDVSLSGTGVSCCEHSAETLAGELVHKGSFLRYVMTCLS